MRGFSARAWMVTAALWAVAGCSADSSGESEGPEGAGGSSAPSPGAASVAAASPEARAVIARASMLHLALPEARKDLDTGWSPELPAGQSRVLQPAAVDAIDRAGDWIVPRIREKNPDAAAPRAAVRLGSVSTGSFRIETPDSRVAVDVSPVLDRERLVQGELVSGYVVYPKGGPGGADVIHRVTAEGTEDFVLFDRPASVPELAYRVSPSDGVAGLRLVADTLELLDAEGAPRLRMAPPYLVDASGSRREARVEVEGCAVDTDPRGPWGRETTPPGASTCTVRVVWDSAGLRYPLLVDPAWTTTGSMAVGRRSFPAVLLDDEKVLVAGGYGPGVTEVDSAELYDRVTGTWATAGSPGARANHIGVKLANGNVLVAGGTAANNTMVLKTAQIYNIPAGTWSDAPQMGSPRSGHQAVLLDDDDHSVLVMAGGVLTAERYVPATNTWVSTPNMKGERRYFAAAKLLNGDVFVAGGAIVGNVALASAEVYSPTTDTWTIGTPNMVAARILPTATVLPSGKVLVAGGHDPNGGGALSSVEIFDPVTATWSPGPALSEVRTQHTATLLSNGKVLVAGGGGGGVYLASTRLYDPLLEAWTPGVDMPTARWAHSATELQSGEVLVSGGYIGGAGLTVAEIFAVQQGGPCTQNAQCANALCVDGFCCDTLCTGPCNVCSAALGAGENGVCSNADAGYAGTCGTFVCDGASVACPPTCADDAGCVGTHYCADDEECHLRKAQGSVCNEAAGADCLQAGCNVCQSGFCADGVCCNTACEGECDACSAAGVCSIAAAGSGGSCGEFVCDGSGASCPTTCDSDTDCVDGAYCDTLASPKICKAVEPAGAACTEATQCQSGFCADSVCCDQACNGQCEACDGASPGVCAPLQGAPHAGHTPCKGTGGACGGTCDGVNSAACVYPGATTACGSSCVDGMEFVNACDGNGACTVGDPAPCAPYKCEGVTECKAACVTDADCVSGYSCEDGGVCAPASTTCADDHTLEAPGGQTTDCAPYKCEGGACLQVCSSIDDCVAPSVCDATTNKCVAPDGGEDPGGDDEQSGGGCACVVAGGAPGGGLPWQGLLGAAALAALWARRRRS